MSDKTLYPNTLSVRLDNATLEELEIIARFEKTRRAEIARRILVEKTQVYQRRPEYKAFKKELERMLTKAGT